MPIRKSAKTVAIAVAFIALSPIPAYAAETTTTNRTTTTTRADNEGGFPWGILGLFGLAGLLGLRKKERDIHVDARRNNP